MDEIERLKEGVVRQGGIVRAGTALAVPAVLRSLGANPADVLAGAGVDLALFDNPDNPIPFAVRSRLIGHCVEQTGCRHFGLLVGQHVWVAIDDTSLVLLDAGGVEGLRLPRDRCSRF